MGNGRQELKMSVVPENCKEGFAKFAVRSKKLKPQIQKTFPQHLFHIPNTDWKGPNNVFLQ